MIAVTDVAILDGGPLGRSYPAATLALGSARLAVHRRFGSWMADADQAGRLTEVPHAAAIELQAHPDVRRFDRERRREAEAAAATEPEPESREWVAGDRVMWLGQKARVIGPSRQEGRVRIKCQKRVQHVLPTDLTERGRR